MEPFSAVIAGASEVAPHVYDVATRAMQYQSYGDLAIGHIVSTNTFETEEESLEAAKRVMLAINSPSRMRYVFEENVYPSHQWYFYRRES